MDILERSPGLTATEILQQVVSYLSCLPTDLCVDESSLRKKIKEYESLGLIYRTKSGRNIVYHKANGNTPSLSKWQDAVSFFSEAAPLGVIGSFILDKYNHFSSPFRFKHHYILHALDSDILCALFLCMSSKKDIHITVKTKSNNSSDTFLIHPMKIYISTQTGRQYIIGYHYAGKNFMSIRLDNIIKLRPQKDIKNLPSVNFQEKWRKLESHIWGVSLGKGMSRPDNMTFEHVELILHVNENEPFILSRLQREKRNGHIMQLNENTWIFTTDVLDAKEMLPWIRTFTGRIMSFTCTNPSVTDTFYNDLYDLQKMYLQSTTSAAILPAKE